MLWTFSQPLRRRSSWSTSAVSAFVFVWLICYFNDQLATFAVRLTTSRYLPLRVLRSLCGFVWADDTWRCDCRSCSVAKLSVIPCSVSFDAASSLLGLVAFLPNSNFDVAFCMFICPACNSGNEAGVRSEQYDTRKRSRSRLCAASTLV